MLNAISLTEEFNNNRGAIWNNYDAYQQTDRTNMAGQKHVDIRVFRNTEDSVPINMITLSAKSMTYLNTQTMANLQATISVGRGEQWTGSTPVQVSGDQYVRGLTVTTNGSGAATAASVINGYEAIDLLTGFENDDHIVLSMPTYEGNGSLTEASCFLDLTSHPTGDFTTGPTASAAFSTSVTTPTTGANSEIRFLRSQFAAIDLSKVTGVRIRLTGAINTQHKFLGGVRLLSKTWKYNGLDIDTRYGTLRRTAPRNGNVAAAKDFTQPILWRSNEPAGENDPRPIDVEMGVVFNPGTITNSSNQISLYFRELTEDFLTQLDINGMKMRELTGFSQPDIGDAKYSSRQQTDLEAFLQNQLGSEDQFSLERTADYLSASWIQINLTWSPGSASVMFSDTEGNSYTFAISGGLTSGQSYLVVSRIEENTLRTIIYTIDSTGAIVAKVFDTTNVKDSFVIKRRQGRFGWFADLKDGDGWINSIRERYTMFGEYRSLPYDSVTPVDGAELFAGFTPNEQLFSYFVPSILNTANTSISRDKSRSTTGESYVIKNTDGAPLQGIQTNDFTIRDFSNTRLTFDIWYPESADDLRVLLVDSTNSRWVDLVVPNFKRGQWQSLKIDLPYSTLQTGDYRIIFSQPNSSVDDWWIDNASVFVRRVVWEGRAVADDPWKSNNSDWTPFREISNRESGGVIFPQRGNSLQIRAKALRQFAEINRIQFKPKYSQLGNIPKAASKTTGGLVYASSTSATGGTLPNSIKFTATGVSTFAAGAYVASYRWTFGDGDEDYGSVVQHQYPASGTYPVTLTMIDNFGNQGVFTFSQAV